MANYIEGKDDAKYIISALRDGLDYSKIGDTMIALMQLIEDYCEQTKWHQANLCCKELVRLAEDSDVQAASNVDPAYTTGIAHMCQGSMFLSQDNSNEGELRAALQSAEKSFARSQGFFQEADAKHSEAVALLARGIVYQRQHECNLDFPAEQHWSEALKALQRSLTIFGNLGDGLQFEVRLRLAEVGELFQKNVERGKTRASARPMAKPSTTGRQGKIIPIVGRIAAGELILAEENKEGDIIVDEEIADRADFALRIQGDSMIEAAILDSDIVLIEQKRDRPPNGQIVAVIVEQMDVEATLKRFFTEKDHIRLEPANGSYPFIIVKPDEVPDDDIRTLYHRRHPKRLLEIYSGADPQIAGWAIALIREKVQ